MIIFPATGVFIDLGAIGVSMFFVSYVTFPYLVLWFTFGSTIVSQVIYSAGASGFPGANGSMMIEVVVRHPYSSAIETQGHTSYTAFLSYNGHPYRAGYRRDQQARDRGHDTSGLCVFKRAHRYGMPTRMSIDCRSQSSFDLTGLTFFLLGFFRLGSLIGFFPRHILVGCIGGVGVFLIITGLNVSTRLQDDEFSLSLDTLLFFLRGSNLVLWAPALALAALLRVITSRWHHQLILPTCAHFLCCSMVKDKLISSLARFYSDFLIIPTVFYIVVLSAGFDLDTLRRERWLFEAARSEEKWYSFYTYFGGSYFTPRASLTDRA